MKNDTERGPRAVYARRMRAFLIPVLWALAAVEAPAEIIENMPDAIVCSVKDPTGTLSWDQLVYYVSAHMTTGDTLFKTLTSDPVVLLVNAEGIVKGPNLADCDGRSVASLREDGRAFDIIVTGTPAPQSDP